MVIIISLFFKKKNVLLFFCFLKLSLKEKFKTKFNRIYNINQT